MVWSENNMKITLTLVPLNSIQEEVGVKEMMKLMKESLIEGYKLEVEKWTEKQLERN